MSIPGRDFQMKTLPTGYSTRQATVSDAPAVAGLIATCEQALTGQSRTTTAAVENDWIGYDLADSAVCVLDAAGAIVAYADIFNRSYRIVNVYGYVHPAHRGRGLGSWLVSWGEQWIEERMRQAPDGVRVVVQHYVRDIDVAYRRHIEAAGYREVRRVYVMERDLPAEPMTAPSVEGYRIRSYVPGVDDLAAHLAFEEGAADMWERPASSLENWRNVAQRSVEGLILLAETTNSGDIAAVCTCNLTGDEGWIRELAVVPAHRRKGLGFAILTRAFEELSIQGAKTAGLSVDSESPTGADKLYVRAGMRETETYVVYRKEIRPGVGLGEETTAK
jgi:GNAT superfamily N-acetyltransferase